MVRRPVLGEPRVSDDRRDQCEIAVSQAATTVRLDGHVVLGVCASCAACWGWGGQPLLEVDDQDEQGHNADEDGPYDTADVIPLRQHHRVCRVRPAVSGLAVIPAVSR